LEWHIAHRAIVGLDGENPFELGGALKSLRDKIVAHGHLIDNEVSAVSNCRLGPDSKHFKRDEMRAKLVRMREIAAGGATEAREAAAKSLPSLEEALVSAEAESVKCEEQVAKATELRRSSAEEINNQRSKIQDILAFYEKAKQKLLDRFETYKRIRAAVSPPPAR
jgi:hypothetical protein